LAQGPIVLVGLTILIFDYTNKGLTIRDACSS
jgi:hypothetical protein